MRKMSLIKQFVIYTKKINADKNEKNAFKLYY